jgi:hypothetical protein hcinC1_10646
MERRKKKAINFDLDTAKMKKFSLYPAGYKLLKKSFQGLGFEHRQGSGYISAEKLDSDQINDIIGVIIQENPWLAECVRKIDVTDIGRQHDLTSVVKEYAALTDDLQVAAQTAELLEEGEEEAIAEEYLPHL